jgi:cobyrinic acid a,c-diamide synthase
MAAATASFPRFVVAGLSGGSGKTLASLALLLTAVRRGIPARGFKKGPDYIDSAWLGWACGREVHNLDSYLMGFERAGESFRTHASETGLNVVEGNRGLYDGLDACGTHSTAELAKALHAPVLLVVNAAKITRTAAALVLGCQKLDPGVWIAGVILNQVSAPRHERTLRDAIESACQIPVLGAIPRAEDSQLLPMRHLGLVTPEEHPNPQALVESLLALVYGRLDWDRILAIAGQAPALPLPESGRAAAPSAPGVRIGYVRDSAFTFYYPENLDALRAEGAELVPVSALSAAALPEGLDALYIGGGFPETHVERLSSNLSLLASVRRAAESGLPMYAECGGLMFLARGIVWQGRRYPMAGALPFDVEVCAKPQGHGYAELLVDAPNPFFPEGQRLKGHEFHYSKVVPAGEPVRLACAVLRGAGCLDGRDAVTVGGVWASFTHVHALSVPAWAPGLVGAARRFARLPAPA